MSWRIMPYRSVDEHEVINGLFSSTTVNTTHLTAGDGDAGVFVKVDPSNASLNRDPLVYESNSTVLGKVDYPDVGRNYIPVVQNKVAAATSGARCVGLTLAQTALEDENGVTFYNDPRKADALGVIPSGGAVPVLVRGQVTLCETAFDTATITAPGSDIMISETTAGKVSGIAYGGAGTVNQVVGTIVATGSRVAGSTADRFAGAAGETGEYALCYISCV